MPRDILRNFVFIHIPKNAGKFAEDRYGLSDNPLKQKNINPRDNLRSRIAGFAVKTFNSRTAKKHAKGMFEMSLVGQHLTLIEMEAFGILNYKTAEDTIFTIIRNPFTRIVSLFYHHTLQENQNQKNFDKFCEEFPIDINPNMSHRLLAHKRNQCDFVKSFNAEIENKVIIIRFENLISDLNKFEIENNLAPKVDVTSQNSDINKRGKRPKYSQLENKFNRHLIIKNYENDFVRFNYDY